jgi:benzoyl-CoA reductase/2-hydroxyglutaryl-CoA dehydratase subunit BcrC/BadD/HgdB
MQIASIDNINAFFEGNALRVAQAKENGKKVVGAYCIYAPGELALAAGAIPVSLCGTRQDSIPAAESILPRSLCPLIKSSYGFFLEDSCPYLAAADLVVGETTCDGKKKMFEILGRDKNVIVLQLPQTQATEESLTHWTRELHRLAARIEDDLHASITADSLRAAIRLMDRERSALKRVMDAAKHDPSPVTGMQLVELGFKTSFLPDKEQGIALLEEVADELEHLAAAGKSPVGGDAPRIIVTGVPVGMGSHKVIKLLDECGAGVVCLDNCSCYKKTRDNINPGDNDSRDGMIAALAVRYLDIPCSVMSPNPGRYATLRRLAEEFHADAVVDLTWQGCHTYNVEAYGVKKFVNEELGLPSLHLETDYSESDTEQLRTRIEAFLELLHSRKKGDGQ